MLRVNWFFNIEIFSLAQLFCYFGLCVHKREENSQTLGKYHITNVVCPWKMEIKTFKFFVKRRFLIKISIGTITTDLLINLNITEKRHHLFQSTHTSK